MRFGQSGFGVVKVVFGVGFLSLGLGLGVPTYQRHHITNVLTAEMGRVQLWVNLTDISLTKVCFDRGYTHNEEAFRCHPKGKDGAYVISYYGSGYAPLTETSIILTEEPKARIYRKANGSFHIFFR